MIDKKWNEPLTKQEVNHYDEMSHIIAFKLQKEGLTQELFLSNPDLANRFMKYVEEEFIKKNAKLRLNGIIQKMAVFEINTPDGKQHYPVIHVYKGHWLFETIYFKLDPINPNAFHAVHIPMPK